MELMIKSQIKRVWQYFAIVSMAVVLAACSASANQPYTTIDNNELKTLMESGTVLVDIRRPEEWKQTGIVEGSKTLTFFFANGRVNPAFIPQIQQQVAKDQPIALICRTGNRTRAASEFLASELGYATVYNVKHGITGWIAEKNPVVAVAAQ
ncbi:MAG TPA: sulfurtransferase [Thiothrix sp.]|nr:sulfurtransferase [Thiothrix sp.]